MKKIIALILILAALAAGYVGIDKLGSSESGIKIGDLELKAEDTSSKNTAYMYIGGAVVCLVAGIILISGKNK